MNFSRKIDLVQDAATDCSVVASLSAVTARAELGHAKVRICISNSSTVRANG